MGGLAQQGPDARDGRGAGSGSAHDDVSLRLELRMCQGMCKLPPVSTPETCGSARQCLTESWHEYTGACWWGWRGGRSGRMAVSYRGKAGEGPRYWCADILTIGRRRAALTQVSSALCESDSNMLRRRLARGQSPSGQKSEYTLD
jgi:hypothetical protein